MTKIRTKSSAPTGPPKVTESEVTSRGWGGSVVEFLPLDEEADYIGDLMAALAVLTAPQPPPSAAA
ncbi:MAG: hypothetical protein JRE70_18410 [Deltaproteobacteria bacterium]|nr:hypothetical protein [Deltaproteobacteria bacterium]